MMKDRDKTKDQLIDELADVRQRVEKYQSLVNAAGDLVFSVDIEGKILFANAVAKEFTGYEVEEAIGRNFSEYAHPDDAPALWANIQQVLDGEPLERIEGIGRDAEYRMMRRDGQVIWVATRSQPIKDAQGKIVGFNGIVRDITERVRAEEALRESEEQFRVMFESSHDLLTIADKSGKTLLANPAWQKTLGYTPETQGDPMEKVHPDDRARVIEAWQAAQRGEADFTDVEYRYRTARGEYVFLAVTARDLVVTGRPLVSVVAHDVTERKRLESHRDAMQSHRDATLEALRESEEKYRQLFATESDAIMVFDAETRGFLDVNEAALSLYGYSREEFLNLRHPDITAEPDQSMTSIEQTLAGEITRIPIRYHRKKDGTVFPVEISASTFTLKGRAVLCGVIRDIIERKQMEDALRDSHEKYRSVIENADVGILVIQDSRRVFYNSKVYEMLGYTDEEYRNSDFLSLIHPEDRSRAVDRIRQRLTGVAMDPNVAEMRALSKSGDIKWIEANSVVIQWEGKPAVQAFVADITERKLMQDALRESEARIRLALEGTDEGLWDWDMVTGAVTYDDNWIRILGYTPGEFAFDSEWWDSHVHPDSQPIFDEALDAYLQGREKYYELEYQLRAKSGEWRWIWARGICVSYGDQGQPLRMIGTHRDITERVRAEEQIKAALAEREVLLREVHHRVKNNLQALIHLIDIQTETMADQESLPAFEDLQGRIRTMAMIHEKLYRSKDLAQVDFGEFLEDLTARLYYAVGGARPVALRVHAADDGHPEGLFINVNVAIPCGLIVNELVTNALKHAFPKDRDGDGDRDREIWVEFRSKEGECVLVVGDNGIGLPPDLDWRATESLGLKLVKLWATYQLGGSLQVDAQRGTRFSLRFAA